MQRQLLITSALLSSLLLSACPGPGEDVPPEPLEIGTLAPDGTFVPLSDGATMPVVLGANGLNMIVPSVRAEGVNPRRPNPDVVVDVASHTMAAILLAERVDMVPEAEAYVLKNLQVPFQTELCCYICTEGTITASLRDGSGRRFEGEVTVRFERDGCPDVDACCATADACPDPTLTQVCE